VTAFYVSVFLASACLSILLTRFIRDEAIHHGWLDRPDTDRHFHSKAVPRIGGIALLLSIAGASGVGLLILHTLGVRTEPSFHMALAICLPAMIVFFTGLYDDIYSLGPYWKFSGEAVAAICLYAGGLGIHRFDLYSQHTALRISVGLPLTVFWVLLVTNAFNLIDGLDGLAAGSAFFATVIIFVVSLGRSTSLISLLSIALAGSVLGFLRYNFHPATIFLGDSGSLLIGFLLSALALASSQKATTIVAVSIPVISFGLPILDVTLSVIRRFLSGNPLFRGDHEHIHHKLINRGWSHRKAVLVLYLVAAAFGLISLTMLHGEVMLGFVLIVVGVGVWWGVQKLKYLEFYELAQIARRLRQNKRIIANNVGLRRAIESLLKAPPDLSEICSILETTLEPIGFSGTAFKIDSSTQSELTLFPLCVDDEGRLSHLWGTQDPSVLKWELRLELRSRSGEKLGDFFLFRANASAPLWVDINLLDYEFRAAVSAAVERAIDAVPMVGSAQAHMKPTRLAKALAASSQSD
jgi:UDP-GlcNAc:undecaprenyl-phosphate GlcNAc-1-phosphate transferase